MTLKERLRQLAYALPSDRSAITMTRGDLVALLEGDIDETDVDSARDLTVQEVADETNRAPSTVRGWLISGALRGYKFNNRDWRVPGAALREYLEAQVTEVRKTPRGDGAADISAWRKARDDRPHGTRLQPSP